MKLGIGSRDVVRLKDDDARDAERERDNHHPEDLIANEFHCNRFSSSRGRAKVFTQSRESRDF
jgi:hypothetical protein